MDRTRIKRQLAAAFERLAINSLGFAIQRALMFPFIRVVNYHDVRPEHVENFEAQLQFYASEFVDVNESRLRGFSNGEPWTEKKPGIILSFDDGFASHAQVVAPLLEKHGFTGWFFVPADRLNSKGDDPNSEGTANREQIISLAKKHVVGSHTTTHCRLERTLSKEKLNFEILDSRQLLSEALGRDVDIFCWVGGEEFTYSSKAAELIKRAYNLSFMTNNAPIRPHTHPLQLQRTNIEADNPLSLVRFQISGILDLVYLPKRRRVNTLTR